MVSKLFLNKDVDPNMWKLWPLNIYIQQAHLRMKINNTTIKIYCTYIQIL